MDMLLADMVTWLNRSVGWLGIIVTVFVAVIPTIWAFRRYLSLRSKELQFERFKIYHQLVRDLVQPEAEGGTMMLDRQIAVAFELRNFPTYYEVTLRMLEGLKRQWENMGHPGFRRLLDEMDLTIDYIRSKIEART